MSPLDCLRSATTVAARVIGAEAWAGSLDPGKFGDMIGVPGDPLENLELVAKPENVHLVVKGGQVVKRRSS
jgi:imidazolonepropionase-like amidohydrolase